MSRWDSSDTGLSELSVAMDGQVASHWREFAVIVVSGNIGAALLTGGLVVTGDEPLLTKAALAAALFASIEAFALAYYSINVGSLQTRGPVRLGHIVDSFGIAGAQFAMPLWISYMARALELHDGQSVVSAGRHWLAFAGAFALLAALANERAARSRSRSTEMPSWPRSFYRTLRGTGAGSHRIRNGEPSWLKDYNDHQWADRCGAARVGVVLMAAWVFLLVAPALGFTWLVSAFVAGGALVIAAFGFTMGLRSQSEVVRKLGKHLSTAGRGAEAVQVQIDDEASTHLKAAEDA